MRNFSLCSTMIIMIWGACALLFMAVMGVDFIFSKDKVETSIAQNAMNQARYHTTKMNAMFSEASQVANILALHVSHVHQNVGDETDEQSISRYLRNILQQNPGLHGLGIAFEPGAFSNKTRAFAPYYNYENGEIVYCQMGDPKDPNCIDYFQQSWYRDAVKLAKPVWSEPYYDYLLMISYSYPIYRDNKCIGAVIIDISLKSISETISQIKLLQTGYSFALSKNGALLSSLDGRPVLEQNINQLNPKLARQIKDFKPTSAEDCLVVKTQCPLRNIPALLVIRPASNADTVVGSIGFVYPLNEINAEIYDLQKESTIVFGIGLVMLFIIVLSVSKTLTSPIVALADNVAKISQGDLKHKVPALSSLKEILVLQNSFNKMSDDLKTYLHELRETVAAKERIENELKIAHQIQASMLPRIFPPFPDRKELDIFGIMEPAREVGGDFYDFFFVDPTHFCMLVGDVSGKGIAAALFMVITKTLLRNEALNDQSPDKMLDRVNELLSLDNSECMFVTVFCAILDTETGEMACANAGHNPPLLKYATGDKTTFEYLKPNKNVVLGVMPGVTFKPDNFKMHAGDIFFLYTDGVNEAMNLDSEQFSNERLQKILNENQGQQPTTLIEEVRQEVAAFTAGTEQSDDITMLVIKYNGPSVEDAA